MGVILVFLGIFGYVWKILGILSTFYWTLVIGSECNFFGTHVMKYEVVLVV